MVKKKYVAYYRVSTKQQANSGLGIEAQHEKVEKYINGHGELVKEFLETESGRKDNRVELAKAAEYCRQTGAVLVIAKLDRLARSASFIFALRDSGVKFEVPDLPDMNPLTLGIFAGLAQYEAEMISERTKAALAVKKRAGVKLGKPENLTDKAREKSTASRRKKAQDSNRQAATMAQDMRGQGMSYRKIAERLNAYGVKTRTGKQYYAMSVKNLLGLYV